jgi:deoxyribonuclease IV
MNRLRFGTAGIPLSTPDHSTLTGIPHVRTLGLEAMELEFVRSIHVKPDKVEQVKALAKQHDVKLTCHGSYFVNMNAQDSVKLEATKKRVIDNATRAWECGAWSICFHMAYYMGMTHSKAYEKIKKNVKDVVKILQDTGVTTWLRPETGGKVVQFSDIDGLIQLSQDVEQVLPCIDWAHHCARTNGKCNDYDSFRKIAIKLEDGLGKDVLQKMHMHIEGIEWSEKGERNHLTFAESQFNYKDAIKVWKEFNMKGVVICESPNIEGDAIIARDYYAAI